MPGKSNGKPVAEIEATEQQVHEEPAFLVEKLRKNCIELFGVSSSTFDGALCGHSEEKLTVNQCRVIINKWLGKE